MSAVNGTVGVCAVLIFGAMLAHPAAAVSITNRDDRVHKVTVIEGSGEQSHSLAGSGVLENVCLKGCVIRLNDSDNDEYELEGTEVVSIEDGYLYYDGPEPEPAPAPPAVAKPPTID